MASLKDIRTRIGSVKNTQKITRAMKLVAAARLRKAQQNIVELRPYALKTADILSTLVKGQGEDSSSHPLLEKRETKKVLFILFTSDRGLAGAFNSSLIKRTLQEWKEKKAEDIEASFVFIGRKGKEHFARLEVFPETGFEDVYENLSVSKASEIAQYVIEKYTSKNIDACYLIYNHFKSAITQLVQVDSLLPIQPDASLTDGLGGGKSEVIYEPNKQALVDTLLPMYVETEIYRALLESVASEHGARMTAMDAATNNATDMISKLTLQFNRARQAAITKELMEIIGGSEAING